MKYTHYYATFILFAASALTGMELTTQTKPDFTFISDEQPPQQFTIQHDVALQCQKIKNMLEDFESTEKLQETIKNARTENILHFISYLKKINHINKLPDSQSKKLEACNTLLSQYIHTLDTTELINLTHTIDSFDVIDKNKNNYVTMELANRIRANTKAQKNCFGSLNNSALFCSVMQKLNTIEELDIKILKPYSDRLTEQYSLPRTEPIFQNFINNMYNAIPWNDPIIFNPYYVNTQTGTIVKVEEIENSWGVKIKTDRLQIIKKNSPPIIIKLTNIEHITNITANADESLFICKSLPEKAAKDEHKNYFIVNLNNPNNPLSGIFYNACAFTKNNEELYVGNGRDFGILNIKTDTFTKINLDGSPIIRDITTNKDATIIAVVSDDHHLFIIKNRENLPMIEINIKNFGPDYWSICSNICLHPDEEKIYLTTCNQSAENATLCSIDFSDFSSSTIIESYPSLHVAFVKWGLKHITFLSRDILLIDSDTENDYFFNIRTGNHWTKKKSSNSARLTLTTDLMQSVNRIASYSQGKTTTTIAVTPLIDHIIINTVDCLNKGYFTLPVLTIANGPGIITLAPDQHTLYKNLNKNLKTAFDSSHTITNMTLLSRIESPFRHLYLKIARRSNAIFIAVTVGAMALTTLIYRTKPDNMNTKDVHDLTRGILWLIQQAIS